MVKFLDMPFALTFVATLAPFLLFEESALFTAIIILGYGHFAITYLYQWRAGKFSGRDFDLSVGLLVFLGALFLLDIITARGLLFSTALFFLPHFFFDEIKIRGGVLSREYALASAGTFSIFTALLLRSLDGADLVVYAVIVAGLLWAGAILLLKKKKALWGAIDFPILTGLFLYTVTLFSPETTAQFLYLGIILFHYVRWYFFYFFGRLLEWKKRLSFGTEVLAINTLFISLFFLTTTSGWVGREFFSQEVFFIATWLHVAFSVRTSDITALFPSWTERISRFWKNSRNSLLVIESAALFLLALAVNAFAGRLATSTATNPVGDVLLGVLPLLDTAFIHGHGFMLAALVAVCILLVYPRYISFTLKAAALLVLVRSIFVNLTNLGIYQDAAPLLNSPVTFGGDLFFSGHAALPFLLALIFWDKRGVRYLFLLGSAALSVVALLGHLHYSIDIFAAYFIAFGVYTFSTHIFKEEFGLIKGHEREA